MESSTTESTATDYITKSAFRSIDAVINLQREPLKILVTGSLCVRFALEKVTLTRIERPNQNPGELLLELKYGGKSPSEKGIFNIFHFAETIPRKGFYTRVTIICEGVESDSKMVREEK
ncbi:MAG: hypothetical protein HYZ14_02170 [Bacteroidetes bacterium]|nr:hypothetical protein [Bacteroidota bacterium]